MLKKGDMVVMENCGEAEHYEGVVWTCRTNEWITNEGRGVYEQCLVMLNDFSGSFHTKYLRKFDADEAIVTCVACEKKVLHDSQGYYFDGLTGKYSCNKCYEKEIQYQKVQQEVDAKGITHTVLKNEDIEKLPLQVKRELSYLEARVADVRTLEGKEPFPKYIVINTDEDPRMIEEIIKVMKQFRKWG